MLGCLAIALFFIAVVVVLEKTLPDGSKSHFRPSVKGNLDDVLDVDEGLAAKGKPIDGMLSHLTKGSVLLY